MSAESPITLLVRIGILAGFVGLGVLGVALMGMAIMFAAGVFERVVVLILGVFAFIIAVKGVPLMAGRSGA